MKQADGSFKVATWDEALLFAGSRLRELRDTRGGRSIGVIGGNRLTNEEAYLLQKFARTVLGTNNIDHHRTADFVTLAAALREHRDRFASQRDNETAKAILLIGGDPTNEAPLTAWNLRTNVRLNRAKLYVANHAHIKLHRQAKSFLENAPYGYGAIAAYLGGDEAAAQAAATDTE